MNENLLLDTCVVLWWALDPKKIPPAATRHLHQAEDASYLLVSTISLFELGTKIRKKKLEIGMPIDAFRERLLATNFIKFVDITPAIAAEASALVWDHRDPADRIIVVSAHAHDAVIITPDQTIAEYYQRCRW